MDASKLRELYEKRANLTNQLREHAEKIEAEGREYTGDETQTESRMVAELSEFDTRIRNGLAILESEDATRSSIEKLDGLDRLGRKTPAATETESDADILRKMGRGERGGFDFLPTEVRDAGPHGVSKQGPPSTQQPGVVKPTIYEALYEYVRLLSTVMVANARVMRTTSGEPITIPKVSAHVAATIVGEGAVIGESDPQFVGSVTLNAYKYAFISTLTSEVISDAAFDIVGWLASDAGQAFVNGPGRHFLTGTGSGQPQGLLVGASSGLTLASKSAITGDEIINLYHSILSPYRANGVFLANDLTVAAIRKLKDNQGRYMWQDGLQVGEPDRLLGKQVITDDGVPTLGTVNTRGVLGFGDVARAYTVRYAGALRVDRSVDARFDTDEVAYRFIQRADGKVVDETAFKTADCPAS